MGSEPRRPRSLTLSPKLFLMLMTAVAVVSDSLLHPFYPQYFSEVFAIEAPGHVALYIAACSLTVLLTLPLWALCSRRVHSLRLLVVTQVVTCSLSLACFATTSLTWFWVFSLGMMVFKASYLLIYPYVMSLESKEHHVGTIGLLAFVVYFGNILAALLSGLVFEWIEPRFCFAIMAGGDVVQVLLCVFLLRAPAPLAADVQAGDAPAGQAEAERVADGGTSLAPAVPPYFVHKLGLVMLVMYFSAYLTEPFFSSYWEGVSALDNKIVAGLVFATPGAAALLGLLVNATRDRGGASSAYAGVLPAILFGFFSLWLQVTGLPLAVLAGRFIYGWALFQCMVRLDSLLFRYSTRESYSVDFSKANLFQGLGVLFGSLAAGSLVSSLGARATFVVSAAGFALGMLLYASLFKRELEQRPKAVLEPAAVSTEGIVT